MAGLFQIASPKPISAGIALEPVYNALNSLSLLNEVERMPALDGWVLRTASANSSRSSDFVLGDSRFDFHSAMLPIWGCASRN